jgi:CDP-Glycerol:Poly(glycerophosphate) glycerophosphotransferase
LVNALGAVAAVLFLQGDHFFQAGLLTAGALLAIAWRAGLRRRTPAAPARSLHMTVRALLIAGLASAGLRRLDHDAITMIAIALLLTMVMQEPSVQRLARRGDDTLNLQGHGGRRKLLSPELVFWVNVGTTVWLGLIVWLRWSPWLILAPVLLGAATVVGLYVSALLAWRNPTERLAELRAAVTDYGPEFVLHFSGNRASLHQITMWVPYLDRIGRRYVVIVRERHTLVQLSGQPITAPVVLCNSIARLEASVVDSLRAAFYVNNGMKNTHLVRFGQLYHVQLLHGDSDKPPSYSPVTALYDKVFVAGQAGRDRYTLHGVMIPDEKFAIVGRPQVEDIETLTSQPPRSGPPTVLYAPTWRGQYDDSNFCSLPNAVPIFGALLAAGARVVFRPHPSSVSDPESAAQIAAAEQVLARDNSRQASGHLYGEEATALTIVESFNLSDALVSDVSSVVSDYLFSQKPFAVSDMLDEGPTFARTFPLASAAYVIPRSLGGLTEAVTEMLGPDPLAEQRKEMRRYYLGDFPAEGYAEAFTVAARAVIDLPPKRAAEHEDNDDDEESGAEPVAAFEGADDD